MKKLLLVAVLVVQVSIVAQIPSGTISGEIRTIEGQPASGVRVSAMAVPDANAPLDTATALVSIAMTDNDGRYRLENIRPGRYYITAGPLNLPTYYPGATALSGATALNVLSETPLTGINFSISLPAGVKVSGKVTTTSGAPLQSGRVALWGAIPGMRDVAVSEDGTFEFQRVPPGSYEFSSPSGRSQQPLSIQVADKDIAGLQLVIIPSATISVTTVVDGNSPVPLFRVAFAPFKGGSSIQGTGNFSIPLLEGDYRVGWSSVPVGFEVKSITAGDVDLLTSPLKVSVSSPPPEIKITLRVEGNPWVKFAGKVTGQTSIRTLTLSGPNSVELPVKDDGTFEIAAMLPGQYTARSTPNSSPPVLGGGMREARFVVPSQDTTDFVIAMPALKEVPVVITDTVGIAVQGRISLRYAETRTNGSAAGGFTITPQPDGKFTILMSEGDRRLTIDLPNYKIQSLTYGSTDLMKENMRVTNADTAELRIVVERTIVAIASPQSAQAADPRREKLDTAISEAVRLLESNEYVAFLERYMAPQELERLKERPLQEFAQRFGEDKAPRLLRVLKMITGTTPTLDPDGTKAVYQLSDPIEGKSSITFFKVDKYWYIAN